MESNNTRIIFEVKKDLHHKIKLNAFKKGLSIKEFLTQIITHKFLKDENK